MLEKEDLIIKLLEEVKEDVARVDSKVDKYQDANIKEFDKIYTQTKMTNGRVTALETVNAVYDKEKETIQNFTLRIDENKRFKIGNIIQILGLLTAYIGVVVLLLEKFTSVI